MSALALAAAIALAGCGGGETDSAEVVDQAEASSTTEPATTETTTTDAPATTSEASPTTETTGPAFVGARVVLGRFASSGLEPPNVRDNTDGNCGGEGGLACSMWLTSDILTVIEWDTADDAQTWLDGPLDAELVGERTTVHFQEGGTTPPYDRAAYTTVIADLNEVARR